LSHISSQLSSDRADIPIFSLFLLYVSVTLLASLNSNPSLHKHCFFKCHLSKSCT